MIKRIAGLFAASACAMTALVGVQSAQAEHIILQSTTSTQNSGPVRPHPADLHGGDGYRGAGGRRRHRPGHPPCPQR